MKHASAAWQWLAEFATLEVDGAHEDRTGDVETLLVVLRGTFDMLAGGGSWPARGVRASPHAGKPVALFLPPRTRWRLDNGSGEVLLVSGVQPEREPTEGAATRSEATSRKPLLALAGSGKAFDPAAGEWKDQESFPSSPQALLPRHIEQTDVDGVILRRVFPFGFKALSLSLDEIVLPAGASTGVPPAEIAGYPAESAVYFDAPAGVTIDGESLGGRGCVDVRADSRFTAGEADVFLAIGYAGPKLDAP